MKRLTITAAVFLLLASCAKEDVRYDASGVFEATEVTVAAQVTGEIKSFDLNEGDTVRVGQLVATIDDTQVRLTLDQLESEKSRLAAGREQAEAARRQAEASRRQTCATAQAADARRLDQDRQVAALKQQITNLRQEEMRFRALVARGAGTQKQVDDIVQQIAVLEKQLAAAQEQVSTANNGIQLGQSAYDAQTEGYAAQAEGFSAQARGMSAQSNGVDVQQAMVRDRLNHTGVTSPISGTVLAKYMESGEYATPGRALFKVGNLQRMTLRAYVSAEQATRLKVGQRVTVFADQGTDGRKAYTGTVTWISDRAEFTPRTIQTRDERANLVYAVKIAVTNDGIIKRGMYGDVKF